MKKLQKFTLLLLVNVLIGGVAFAAFPVKQSFENQNNVEVTSQVIDTQAVETINTDAVVSQLEKTTAPTAADDNLLITILLWFFLGGFAAHRWYKRKPIGWNILFILTAGGCGVWAIVDLINILTGNF